MNNEIVLKPSKLKMIRMFITTVIGTALAANMLSGNDAAMGWLCLILCGAASLFFALQLFTNCSNLRISPEGFEVTALFRKAYSVKWTEVDDIFVVRMSQNGLKVMDMVGFTYSKEYGKQQFARSVAKALAECEGSLPDTYGMKAADLVALMQEYKQSCAQLAAPTNPSANSGAPTRANFARLRAS